MVGCGTDPQYWKSWKWRAAQSIRASVSLIPLPLSITCNNDFPASFTNSLISNGTIYRVFQQLFYRACGRWITHQPQFGWQYYRAIIEWYRANCKSVFYAEHFRFTVLPRRTGREFRRAIISPKPLRPPFSAAILFLFSIIYYLLNLYN